MRQERRQNGVVLRRYREGDLTVICRLDEACFAEAFRFDRGAMRRFVGRQGAIVVVAEAVESGEVVGFCVVHMEGLKSGARGYVVTLDVAEEWRRRGLASDLMEAVEAEAREGGAEVMDLHVWTENDGALRFYEGRGYGRMGLVKRFYGAEGLDAFVCRKALGKEG